MTISARVGSLIACLARSGTPPAAGRLVAGWLRAGRLRGGRLRAGRLRAGRLRGSRHSVRIEIAYYVTYIRYGSWVKDRPGVRPAEACRARRGAAGIPGSGVRRPEAA